MDDALGWVILISLFAAPVLVQVFGAEGRRERLRARDPNEFYKRELEHWASKHPIQAFDLLPVDRACPKCKHYPLNGSYATSRDWWRVPKADDQEVLAKMRSEAEPVAWIECPSCRLRSPTIVTERLWTLKQKQTAEEYKLREEARKRRAFAIKRDQEQRRKRKLSTSRGLLSLTPAQFERAVAKILEVNGYSDAAVSGGPGDLTADIFCRDAEGRLVVVQCKKYVDKLVGSREMQSFIGMMTNEHRAEVGLYVTTSSYTGPAASLGRKHGVQLIDGEQLVELAQALHPTWDDEEVQKLLEGPPKKEPPPAPEWVREWRARERRKKREG